jgi:hypothetical protein
MLDLSIRPLNRRGLAVPFVFDTTGTKKSSQPNRCYPARPDSQPRGLTGQRSFFLSH